MATVGSIYYKRLKYTAQDFINQWSVWRELPPVLIYSEILSVAGLVAGSIGEPKKRSDKATSWCIHIFLKFASRYFEQLFENKLN